MILTFFKQKLFTVKPAVDDSAVYIKDDGFLEPPIH